jgi:beta-lactamase regulating signal transducer with metallopeptidase domain
MEENQNTPEPENTEEATATAEQPAEKKMKLPEVTIESLRYLNTAAKWAQFLAIMGFISVGILCLVGIVMGAILSLTDKMSSFPFPVPAGLLGFIYIIIAFVYFFPALYLYRFSTSTTRALVLRDTPSLTDAINNLKKIFKFIGIATIVAILLYILIIIGAIVFSSYIVAHSGLNQ